MMRLPVYSLTCDCTHARVLHDSADHDLLLGQSALMLRLSQVGP